INLARSGQDFYKSLADRLTQYLADLIAALVEVTSIVEAPCGVPDMIHSITGAFIFVEQTITDQLKLMQETKISANELKNISDHPDSAAFATALRLPPQVHLFSVKADDAVTARGKNVVYVDLCVPETRDPDSLRSVATDIAHTLKKTELGKRTAVLYVTDAGTR